MGWHFVGREELLTDIAELISAPEAAVLLTGDPGVGRTTLVEHALAEVAAAGRPVVRIGPVSSRAPFAALAASVPGVRAVGPALPSVIQDLAVGLARHAGGATGTGDGATMVVSVDDAHRVDPATMAVVAQARSLGAAVLATRPTVVAMPDSTDCLWGLTIRQVPRLGPSSVAALLEQEVGGGLHPAVTSALATVTRGNPRALRRLVEEAALSDRLAGEDDDGGGRRRLVAQPSATLRAGVAETAGGDALVRAAEAAWARLDVECTEEICRLAAVTGDLPRVGALWVGASMLRGAPRLAEEVALVLAGDPAAGGHAAVRLAVARAVNLACGLRRPDEAVALLGDTAIDHPREAPLLLAHSAWLRAATGRFDHETRAMLASEPGARCDRETALMTWTARAVAALHDGRPGDAIPQLRRARILGESCRSALPWILPYLDAYLIEAFLLVGRGSEASEAARRFHRATPGGGWDAAVRIAGRGHRPEPASVAGPRRRGGAAAMRAATRPATRPTAAAPPDPAVRHLRAVEPLPAPS